MPRKKKYNLEHIPNATPEETKRNIEMFGDWLQNDYTYPMLGEKYGLSKETVRKIAKKYRWKDLRAQWNERMYAESLQKMDSLTIKAINILDLNTSAILKKVLKDPDSLTKDEQAHLRNLADRGMKEHRLEAGKPTDINSGPVQVEMKLPPGVKTLGVIPTTARSIDIIETEIGEEEQEEITLDDVDEHLEGSDDDQV